MPNPLPNNNTNPHPIAAHIHPSQHNNINSTHNFNVNFAPTVPSSTSARNFVPPPPHAFQPNPNMLNNNTNTNNTTNNTTNNNIFINVNFNLPSGFTNAEVMPPLLTELHSAFTTSIHRHTILQNQLNPPSTPNGPRRINFAYVCFNLFVHVFDDTNTVHRQCPATHLVNKTKNKLNLKDNLIQ